jgi:hypothetical protein
MVKITVDADTAEAIRSSDALVPVHDERGECVGYVMPPLSDEDLEEIERPRDSDGPWYTTAEVMEHRKSVDNQ